jgi:putative hydrolase of the HAD superfamily
MVDVDGVLLVHPDEQGWATGLERDLGVSRASLQSEFFDHHWDDIVHGRAKLRDRLAPVLAMIAPDVSCDTLVGYWFENDAHLNQPLLDELARTREQGFALHLATVQEHERAHYLWETLDFRSRFDGLHYAAELGCAKPDPAFYRHIERRTGLRPDEIFFIDDRLENVAAAQACGWSAALWTGAETLASLMEADIGLSRLSR